MEIVVFIVGKIFSYKVQVDLNDVCFIMVECCYIIRQCSVVGDIVIYWAIVIGVVVFLVVIVYFISCIEQMEFKVCFFYKAFSFGYQVKVDFIFVVYFV